jgi:acetylornithine deacetylase/succinyl-diaminopimelate desuccinylase-like protein
VSAERLARLVSELAQIPAPTFAEEPRLAWVEEQLAAAPGHVRRDGAGNVVWSWGDGAPRLLLLVHVDTVFPAETPLEVRSLGGRLVGPGIGDNAAAVVATLDAVSAVLASGCPEPGAVAFTVGEEGLGNLRGAREACAALRPACAIAVEGQGIERVIVDAVGSIRARVAVSGPGGHSWVDRGSPSAIHALLELGASLVARSTRDVPVNVGLIGGGRSVNAIADAAELTVEARALDEAELEAFTRSLASLKLEAPLAVDVEVLGRRGAGRLDREHELLAAVREVRFELGLPDELGQGSTDANAALALGIPALTLGVSLGSGMHSLEEWIDVESLALGRDQLERVVRRLLDA